MTFARKLTRMNLLVSGVALTIAGCAFAAHDLLTLRDTLVRQLSIQAQMAGTNSIPSIAFDRDDVAIETLALLEANPDVLSASIYTPEGMEVATYERQSPAVGPVVPLKGAEIEASAFTMRTVTLARRIVEDDRVLGTIYIEASLASMYARLGRYAIIAAGVLLVSMYLAFLLSRSVQRAVSTPLVDLAEVSRRITADEGYTARAVARPGDSLEVRYVIESFNEMLARIESRDRSLTEAHDELEARVHERTAELEATNQELEAFSYSVSHDLRAPLRHIMGFASILQERSGAALDERGRRHLATITAAAGRMGHLIDDLLAFSRIGRTSLSPRDVDLGRAVEQARLEIAPDTVDRDIEWRIHDLPCVRADPALLGPVLTNLLSNAVKYSGQRPTARIEIGADIRETEAEIFVRDNGVGFDMRYAGKLFGVFQRLHGTDEFEGTGIGLANVRRIVSRHGGRTWAEGEPGRGATFYFSLPLAGCTTGQGAAAQKPVDAPGQGRDIDARTAGGPAASC